MVKMLRNLWKDEQGQDVAEYALMLAVILVVVFGAVQLIGTNANTIFGQAAGALNP
jgi:Flp pilus assembly pilin Flp